MIRCSSKGARVLLASVSLVVWVGCSSDSGSIGADIDTGKDIHGTDGLPETRPEDILEERQADPDTPLDPDTEVLPDISEEVDVEVIAPECMSDDDCDDEESCTMNLCTNGMCSNPPGEDGETCDDNDPCTLVDICQNGECGGGSISPLCLAICGDGVCSTVETPEGCPVDCGPCGDGVCGIHELTVVDGKPVLLCPLDCLPVCGDGKCQGGENLDNCPLDCWGCGDGNCSHGESFESCAVDCPPACGNGVCEMFENPVNCPVDCMPPCGDGICGTGENPQGCPVDCALCGDGVCALAESKANCPQDCDTACGNGICEGGESAFACPVDCGYCSDGVCGYTETPGTCPQDCGLTCGDGVCSLSALETPCTCPSDCGLCLGCCSSGVCRNGLSDTHCGSGGSQCEDCGKIGGNCQDGVCSTQGQMPCLQPQPASLQFGQTQVGHQKTLQVNLVACSSEPLALFGLHLNTGSSASFSVHTDSLPKVPSPGDPLIIPGGSSVALQVSYTPDSPDVHSGTLVLESDSPQPVMEVPLTGSGWTAVCPVAVILCAEEQEVIPQTVLHLSGNQSYADNGPITQFQWSVEQPSGSQSNFVPSSSFPNPTFAVNVAGTYVFQLDVFDQQGMKSCIPARHEVLVIPDQAIHMELLWHTPADPDETDEGPEAGSDLDLHFLHPFASGPDLDGDGTPDGWFDTLFDCFWFNNQPDWGSSDPQIHDNPSLDRDDTDGVGPEIINLGIPEPGKTYRLGVHYWNDHGYGPSYATIRVYVYASLVFEATDVMLVRKDMWEVCTIDWPSGTVTAVTNSLGERKITPNYESPFFY